MKASYPEQQPNVESLIVDNMNLVKKIAWHMHGRVRSAIEIEDLMQIGYFGLVTAAQKYSPKEGATFASYAVLRIRGAIVDHLRKSSNLCRTTIQMQQKQKKAVQFLVGSLQREPVPSEIAEKMGLDLNEYREWEKAFNANVHQSLDEVYDEYSMWFVSKDNTPEENLDRSQLKNILTDALKELPPKEAMVIQLYYVEELNVYEIAEVMEITTGRVSQIKKSAVLLLRSNIENRY
ncbi:MAG: sigma-70 family RNA polymerase sigma factor [Paracoccaceae bacterium]|nr:MAG: FliA/WhiG family RNA polymerase sigma factor [Alphaproteobacteria bacterium]|tara:strand:+ start:4273 stop:4977 length:705 start_codon:yes stop_codon:yes gene_type:complete